MMPLYLKHVAFVGSFQRGSLPLKDIVYMAGGAPVESVAHFTHYLVVGDGGRETDLYRKWEKSINDGYLITLTPDELRRIAVGLTAAKKPKRGLAEGVSITETAQTRQHTKDLEIEVWQNKRDRFVELFGLPQPDGSRIRHWALAADNA